MNGEVHAILQAVSAEVITEVARKSLGLPDFEPANWSVARLRHEKVIETTGGLYRFLGSGQAGDVSKDWSVVLKIVIQPEDGCQEPPELCFWRRELLAYQSGLLSDLPPAIRAPRCYGVSERAQEGWIWLEDIQETEESIWSLEQYQFAAHQLGQLAGIYLAGKPLPDVHWLCRSFFRSLYADNDWWAKFIQPASPDNAWQRPVVQSVYPEHLQRKVLQIWAEKWQFIGANERLPQVFCHNDAHRRNFFLRDDPRGQKELVVIDWGFCGPGALGNDLGELVGTSLSYFAVEPENAVDLEAAVLEGYLDGLRDAGRSGYEREARLGYLISLGLYWGGTLPCEAAMVQPNTSKVNVEAKYGRSLEAVLPGWRLLAEFALDRVDEARYWIKRLAL